MPLSLSALLRYKHWVECYTRSFEAFAICISKQYFACAVAAYIQALIRSNIVGVSTVSNHVHCRHGFRPTDAQQHVHSRDIIEFHKTTATTMVVSDVVIVLLAPLLAVMLLQKQHQVIY